MQEGRHVASQPVSQYDLQNAQSSSFHLFFIPVLCPVALGQAYRHCDIEAQKQAVRRLLFLMFKFLLTFAHAIACCCSTIRYSGVFANMFACCCTIYLYSYKYNFFRCCCCLWLFPLFLLLPFFCFCFCSCSRYYFFCVIKSYILFKLC